MRSGATPPPDEAVPELSSVPVEDPAGTSAAAATQQSETGSLFSLLEIELTWIIFIFGLIALGLFYLLVRADRASVHTMRMYVIIILVFGTLLVVSSSYSTQQIAPVVGFFGTIAGYLLGRTDRENRDEGGPR